MPVQLPVDRLVELWPAKFRDARIGALLHPASVSSITTNVWDGWNLVEEHHGTGALKRCYLHGAATNEMVASAGGPYGDAYYSQDARGNTTHLSDGNNNVIERYTYYVSGQPSYYDGNNSPLGGSAYGNRFLFGGALYSPQTGLYDMRNRFYLPNIGRFLQADPIGFEGGTRQIFTAIGAMTQLTKVIRPGLIHFTDIAALATHIGNRSGQITFISLTGSFTQRIPTARLRTPIVGERTVGGESGLRITA